MNTSGSCKAARLLGKERLYLLIKLFGCTGIAVQNLEPGDRGGCDHRRDSGGQQQKASVHPPPRLPAKGAAGLCRAQRADERRTVRDAGRQAAEQDECCGRHPASLPRCTGSRGKREPKLSAAAVPADAGQHFAEHQHINRADV